MNLMEHEYDVLIIGGGVVGCAIARELAAYRLKIGVLEKNPDVGYETSARNTGVVHGGFAYDVGSLKAALCVEGNRMMSGLAEELHFPFKRCGKILIGHTEEEYARLLEVIRQGEACGASKLRMVDRVELHAIIPSAEGNFALLSENSGIVDPFLMTSALAENAAENGVNFHLSCEVCGISREDGLWIVRTKNTVFKARWIINSAGAQCGKISEMLGIRGYRIIYSKGDYIVLDPRLGAMVPMPIYTVPSNTYMGIHVTVTTEGNLLLGPTAENREDPEDYGTEQKNLDFLYEEAMRIWPHFTRGDYIRTYSGVLPKWVDENGTIQDFRIEIRDEEAPNAVNLIGIESPGLTASVPIARYVIRLMKEREAFEPNADFNPVRNEIRRFADCTREEQEALIRENPDYGEIVCRCNKVTRAEILAAIRNPLGAKTMAAIKYRTRCMMGRCQGGYCQMRIAQMLETEAGLEPCEVMYECPRSINGSVTGAECPRSINGPVTGAGCPRGEAYFIQEITDPRRTLASSVLVTGGELPLCSVRLTEPVPIVRIPDVMKEIRKIKVEAPLESGTVLIRDVLGLGSDVIATKTIRRIKATQ